MRSIFVFTRLTKKRLFRHTLQVWKEILFVHVLQKKNNVKKKKKKKTK